jgi:NAD(P)-dependent dehydrogenase (short-subunit alcohol dehydrogenase family)
MLRDDLLAGRVLVVAGPPPGEAVAALTALGATTEVFEQGLEDEAAEEWARAHAPLHGLIFDARGAFASADAAAALREALERAWIVARAVATGALIEAEHPGKIVLVAPAPDAGAHAEAVRSGLENLARTLSVEWARHGITAVAIEPGSGTTDAELAELICFLVSPAGDYVSGCRLDLGVVARPSDS